MSGMVVSLRGGAWGDGWVRVDRSSRWGNPFVLERESDRLVVIERYRRWLWREIEADRVDLADLAGLAGKTLACWCAPRPCHADVLLRAADWARRELNRRDYEETKRGAL